MKNHHILGAMKFKVHLQNFSKSINKGRIWWYNILRDKEVSISYILRIYNITEGYVLLNYNLILMKRENTEPILGVKIIEWKKFIDDFGLSIEANPSRVVKNNPCF